MRKEVDLSGGRYGGGRRDGDDESGGGKAGGRGYTDISTTRRKGLWWTSAGRERNLIVRALAVMRPPRQGYPFDDPGRDDPGQVMSGNSVTPGNGGVND
jgi:hypothetical protein